MFQSTHRHGVRRRIIFIRDGVISFNPRTDTGCDEAGRYSMGLDILFQSTHRHGVRQRVSVYNRCLSVFQSTHRHGVRRKLVCSPKQQHQFQSTHRHGVRQMIGSTPQIIVCFNPRTDTGCDGVVSVRVATKV